MHQAARCANSQNTRGLQHAVADLGLRTQTLPSRTIDETPAESELKFHSIGLSAHSLNWEATRLHAHNYASRTAPYVWDQS